MKKTKFIVKNKIYIFSIILFILLNVSFYNLTKYYSLYKTQERIEDFLLNVKALRNFVSHGQKNAIYDLQKENLLDDTFFNPALMSSTYIATRVNEEYNELLKSINRPPVKIRFSSTNPRNPNNKSNDFESNLLEQFNKKEISSFQTIVKTEYGDALYYAKPTKITTDECMRCHSDPKIAPIGLVKMYGDTAGFYEHKGDIRAMLSTLYPMEPEYRDSFVLFLILLASSSIIFLFIIIFFNKYNKILHKNNALLKERIAFEVANNQEKDGLMFQQSKMASMGEMIENITHQWKQPLSAMLTQSTGTLLQKELGIADEKAYLQALETVVKNVNYLSSTIDFFRDFFHEDREEKTINLRALMERTTNIITSSIKKHKVDLENNIDDTIEFRSYENELIQVFLNIINNSKDALVKNNVEPPRYVLIDAVDTPEYVTITIIDNAGGIDESMLDKIFDQYFTTKEKGEGTGIGLYMSKEIVEKHLHGKLKVENIHFTHKNTPCIGAKFIITLFKKSESAL
ncbi:MAG: c-type heme family protein [Candidatus Marinarcus sp.]|uniref:c-type heme family protein n=1 Tax=Candidatus Marinarcus sp. TaxID=3100987 RepID=UPI003B009BFB